MKYSQDWDLSTIPDKLLKREYMGRLARRPRPGGRVAYRCRWCSEEIKGWRRVKAHEPICLKNPRVVRIQAALAMSAPKAQRRNK